MSWKEFEKKKEFLVCVDSDGCAMDTMDIKHFRCFGPCMVEEWALGQWKEEILNRWNEINLYTMTRGINRFKGLAKMLREIDGRYCSIDGIEALEQWVEESPELSNSALEKAIEEEDRICLRKALSWSRAVNERITQLPEEEKKPFAGVKEALAAAAAVADVAVVSSANLQAVLDEWGMYGLLEYVDVVLAQDAGSKAFCIGELAKKGYRKEHILMTGDAPGDMDAAQKNGVCYYPILVRKETESWERFREEALNVFTEDRYEGTYQEERNREFRENLQ